MKQTLIFCLFSIITLQGFSQIPTTTEPVYKNFNRFYVGLNGGAMVNFANIKENDYMPADGEWRFGGGAIVGYQVSPILGLQSQFIYGDVAGKKTLWLNNTVANKKFDANVMEFGFNATVSLSKWWAPRLKLNQKFDFYGLVGFGLVAFRSRLYTLDQETLIAANGYASDGTTKQSRVVEAVFPIGIGVKYKISEKWNVAIETNLRNINSDKFDAFERQSNPKDKYSYTFVGVQYIFGKKDQSLDWVDMIEYEKMSEQKGTDNLLLQKIDSLGREVTALKNKGIDSIAKVKVKPVEDKVVVLDKKTDDITIKVDSLVNDNKTGTGAILSSIYFKTGSSKITVQNQTNLASVALYMKSNPSAHIKIVAHTDKRDKYKVNYRIANARADATIDKLVKEYGIDRSRFDIDIKESKDLLSNSNNAINRRVDFIISK